MDEIRFPQRYVNRIERRWTAGLAQMPEARQRPERAPPSPSHESYDPLRSPQVRRLLEGSLRPPTAAGLLGTPPGGYADPIHYFSQRRTRR
jgi:hypothetical protein